MKSLNKLKQKIQRFKKLFKNKKFRDDLKKEKKKKYLFKPSNTEKSKLISFNFVKNKNLIPSIFVIKENIKNYKIYYFFIGFLLIFLSLYIVTISPYFRISPAKTIIERLDTITDINIAYKAIEKFYWDSIFFIDKNEIEKTLRNYQKNIKNISISRLYPNWLKIIIDSHNPQFFTQFAWIDKKYIVTSNWVLVYEKNIDKVLFSLEIIDENLMEAGFFDYKEGIDEKTMHKIIYLKDSFLKTFTNKNIAKFVYYKLENEVHLILESWVKIIFELNNDILRQIMTLKFYNDDQKDILSSWELTYIDVRIFGKIYVCKDKNICNKNLKRVYK